MVWFVCDGIVYSENIESQRWVSEWCMYISICINTYIHTWTYTHAYIHTYIHTCNHAYIRIWEHTCIHTHMRTCVRTYIYTYIHSFIHTCIHTYIYKHLSYISIIGLTFPKHSVMPFLISLMKIGFFRELYYQYRTRNRVCMYVCMCSG